MIAKANNSTLLVSLRGVPQMPDHVCSQLAHVDAHGLPMPPEIVAEADATIAAAMAEIQRRMLAKMMNRGGSAPVRYSERGELRGVAVTSYSKEYDDADE